MTPATTTTAITVNQNMAEMEYAVRGPIPQRAAELARQGRQTILCNIGNPQALGQNPISYYREILAFLEVPQKLARERHLKSAYSKNPEFFNHLKGTDFASDHILELCDNLLTQMGTGLGAYTDSKGPLFIRTAVAEFIDQRDANPQANQPPSDPESIFLTNGASEAVRNLIDLLIADPADGIMIPIPQYPLYSAALRRAGGTQVNYYPDEDRGWALDRAILEDALAQAQKQGTNVKAIVVINPGNPTGAILPRESIAEIVDFAHQHSLAIIADEVYQDNLYGGTFVSFATVVADRPITLFSLHSTSKGYYGECGRRGGYLEVRNPPALSNTNLEFGEILTKQASVNLCSNTVGQIMTYLMVSPPPPGSEPYHQFAQERDSILSTLYDKATMIRKAFTEMEGLNCFGETGAMYLFPRLEILPKGTTDFDYCINLLESTGLCTVNGAGFGQKIGTNHLRIAFLPPRELLEKVLPAWIKFHREYLQT